MTAPLRSLALDAVRGGAVAPMALVNNPDSLQHLCAPLAHAPMAASDSARLLCLLDADAPPAPWRASGAPALLSDQSCALIRNWLDDQALHDILSSSAQAGVPGLSAVMPARWIGTTGNDAAAGIVLALAPWLEASA